MRGVAIAAALALLGCGDSASGKAVRVESNAGSYAVSFEPSITIAKGSNSFTFGVPVAIYRNRFISVPDAARGAHGDAAFADWLLLTGFTRKF